MIMTMKVLLVKEDAFDLGLLQNFVDAGACSFMDIDIPVASLESSARPVPCFRSAPELSASCESQAVLGRHQRLLDKVKEYLDNHYMNPDCTLFCVARYVHVSHSHLSLIFKEAMGTTFTHYLTQLRIKKAKHLLSSTDMMVYEITTSVGYENPTYFSTVFKKATGLSPKEYRNEKRVITVDFGAARASGYQKS